MSTNNKFKAGDKVVCVSCSEILEVELFRVYTVEGVNHSNRSTLKVIGNNTWIAESRFVHERDFTLACINHLFDKGIELELFYSDTDKFFYKCRLGYSARTYTTKELIDTLYPTETPQQKKLKELEEQQRKIAAEMQALRESMS